MSARHASPRRRLRSEILPLASVVFLSLAVVALFPRGVLRYVRDVRFVRSEPAPPRPSSSGCAFITLTPAQEAVALAAARASWQGKSTAAGLRAEMLPAELPEMPHAPVLELADRPSESIGFSAYPQVRTLPPSVAAPAPARLTSAGADAPRPAFPRETMLELSR